MPVSEYDITPRTSSNSTRLTGRLSPGFQHAQRHTKPQQAELPSPKKFKAPSPTPRTSSNSTRLTGLEVLNLRGDVLRYIDNSLKKDKEVALLAFEDLVGYQLKYLDKALKNDFEVVYAAVSTHGSALEFASDKLKKNKDIALRAIRNDPKAIKYVDTKLIEDRKFILEAIEVNLLVKEYLENIN